MHMKGCKKTDIMRICHVGVSKKISIFSLLGPALMKISLHRENNLHFWQVHAQRVLLIKFHCELLFLLQHSLSHNRVKRTVIFLFQPARYAFDTNSWTEKKLMCLRGNLKLDGF